MLLFLYFVLYIICFEFFVEFCRNLFFYVVGKLIFFILHWFSIIILVVLLMCLKFHFIFLLLVVFILFYCILWYVFGLWGLHNIFYDVYWIILYASDIRHLVVFCLVNNCAKIGVILKIWSPISPQVLLNIFLYFYGFNCKIFIAIELIFLRRKFLWNLIKIKLKI